MTLFEIILVGLTLFLGSMLQSAVGFAFALFALPILIWSGLSLREAVMVLSAAILIQVSVGTYRLREAVHWPDVGWATLIRGTTIPIGVWLLSFMNGVDQSQIKQGVGILILIALGLQFGWQIKPQARLHGGWSLLAFGSSGILYGLATVGGPPMVLWVMAHDWPTERSRSFLFATSLAGVPIQLSLLFYTFGETVLPALLVSLAFVPLVATGAMVGVYLGSFISKARLRQIVFGLLVVIALSSILSPMLG